MVVRHADFRVSFHEKICYLFTKKSHPACFRFYKNQFEEYALCSYKKIFINQDEGVKLDKFISNVIRENASYVYVLSVKKVKKKPHEKYVCVTNDMKLECNDQHEVISKVINALEQASKVYNVFMFDGIDELNWEVDGEMYNTINNLLIQNDVSVFFFCKDFRGNPLLSILVRRSSPTIVDVKKGKNNEREAIQHLNREIEGTIKLCRAMSGLKKLREERGYEV